MLADSYDVEPRHGNCAPRDIRCDPDGLVIDSIIVDGTVSTIGSLPFLQSRDLPFYPYYSISHFAGVATNHHRPRNPISTRQYLPRERRASAWAIFDVDHISGNRSRYRCGRSLYF